MVEKQGIFVTRAGRWDRPNPAARKRSPMEERRQFARMAARGVHDKVLELALPHLQHRRLLVAGAGEGALETALMAKGIDGSRITSLDINPAQFKARGLNCLYGDLNEALPFDSESFDACFAVEVIEHLNHPQKFIDETHRVLSPQGLLFLSTPNVHSIAQKIRYLFTDELHWFRDKDHRNLGHIHPIFDWLLRRMVDARFDVLAYDSQRFRLRLLTKAPGIPVPVKHRYFADNNIYVMRKIGPSGVVPENRR
jgi:SAM-dependent methyltransferase